MPRRYLVYAAIVGLLLLGLAVRWMKSSTDSIRRPASDNPEALIRYIGQLRSRGQGGTAELIELAQHPNLGVARAAFAAVSDRQSDEVKEFLVDVARSDEPPQRRAAAIAALGKFPQTAATDLLALVGTEQPTTVRVAAAQSLARISGPQQHAAVPTLVVLLRDRHPEVRKWAIRGIHRAVPNKRFFYVPAQSPAEQQARIDYIEERLRELGVLNDAAPRVEG